MSCGLDNERDATTRQLAARYCDRNGVKCGWYHGEWVLLKSLDIVSTAAVHSRQLQALSRQALAALPPSPRILLSGATDDALLRILAELEEARRAEVTALDICDTPLALMKEGVPAGSLKVVDVRADILQYENTRGFDLILTHAFMGNFTADERPDLVARWFALLRPGGRLVTIQRIRPTGTPPVIGFSDEEIRVFVQAALESAAGRGIEDLSRVERAATLFAQNKRTHVITSRAQFEQLFSAVGFELMDLQYSRLPTRRRLSGPSVPSGGEYALLMAGKEPLNQ